MNTVVTYHKNLCMYTLQNMKKNKNLWTQFLSLFNEETASKEKGFLWKNTTYL